MEIDAITIWGFFISVLGTILSLASLILAFIIRNNTKRISEKLFKKHLKDDYKKSKSTIIQQLDVIYNLYTSDKTVDRLLIKETLISLNLYEDLYSKKTKKLIANIEKEIKKNGYDSNINGMEDNMLLIYKVRIQLEKDYGLQQQQIEEELG